VDDGGGVRVEGEPAASGDGPRLEQRDRVCGAQWLDLMDHFAVQAQRDLTGRHDVQAWCFVQQGADQGGDRVDDVLAAVQHQHRLGTGEPLDEALLAAGQVQGLGDQPRDGGAGVGGVEPDQPDTSWDVTAAGSFHGQTGLADAGRPGQCHQAMVPGQHRQGVEVGRTSHDG